MNVPEQSEPSDTPARPVTPLVYAGRGADEHAFLVFLGYFGLVYGVMNLFSVLEGLEQPSTPAWIMNLYYFLFFPRESSLAKNLTAFWGSFQPAVRSIAAVCLIIGSVCGLRRHPACLRWLAAYGLITIANGLLFLAAYSTQFRANIVRLEPVAIWNLYAVGRSAITEAALGTISLWLVRRPGLALRE